MSEVKLFGKMIQLASNDDVLDAPRAADLVAVAASEPNSDHNLSCSSASVSPKSLDDDKKQSNATTDSAADNPGTPTKDKEESESSIISQEEEPSKKPDKILPCPRCNSNDTKFCYFNNYNLNQPRHFCKNCQRYWTAGGAVRNVPVGSGRRKTKSPLHPPPHCVTNGLISPETEQLPKKSFHGFSPNCFPAPPWYPAQWGPVSVVATPSPFWSYEVASSPLGKHSREGDLVKSLGCDKEESGATKPRVLVPKTLRIDDPSEAAKSSIWATLGIRNEKGNPIGSGGVFGGFRSKGGDPNPNQNSGGEGSLVLQANPAAFSRSLRFHESAE